jgi:segregation and condensation protein B
VERTKKHIEALLFAADQPLSLEEIRSVLEESLGVAFDASFIEAQITELQEEYRASDRTFEIIEIGAAFQLMTKHEFQSTLHTFLKQSAGRKLSNASLETLAIIAYQQPVTKTSIESIRGVNSDYLIQKLLDRELIHIIGREESPGRPLLYGTSHKFMDHFGLKSIKDLPKLKEFSNPENTIGISEIQSEN